MGNNGTINTGGGNMMKRVVSSLCLILVMFSLAACKQVGKTNNAMVSIGKSNKFSEKEINNAINCVKKKFKYFKGCNLTKLWYDEEKSNNFIEGYMKGGRGSINGVKAENVIVLLSNFDVDASGGDGSLNPNSTYHNWNWILIRNSKTSNWRIDDWGY